MNGISCRSSISENQMSFYQGDRVVSASNSLKERFSSSPDINMPIMSWNPILDMYTQETIVRPLSSLSGESSSSSESELRLGNGEGDSSSDSEPENCRPGQKRKYVAPDCSEEIHRFSKFSKRASSIAEKIQKYKLKYQRDKLSEKISKLQTKQDKLSREVSNTLQPIGSPRRPETLIDRPNLLLNITGISSEDILSNLLDVSNQFMNDVRGGFFGIGGSAATGKSERKGTEFNSRSDVDLFINVPPEIFDRIPLERRDRDASFAIYPRENPKYESWMDACLCEIGIQDEGLNIFHNVFSGFFPGREYSIKIKRLQDSSCKRLADTGSARGEYQLSHTTIRGLSKGTVVLFPNSFTQKEVVTEVGRRSAYLSWLKIRSEFYNHTGRLTGGLKLFE